MPHYDVAYTREQGRNIIVVPMVTELAHLPD